MIDLTPYQATLEKLDVLILGNRLFEWIISLAIFVAAAIALKLFIHFIVAKLKLFAEKTDTQWDDLVVAALKNTHFGFILSFALYLSTLHLKFSPKTELLISKLMILGFLVQVGFWSSTFVSAWVTHRLSSDPVPSPRAATYGLLEFAMKLLILSFLALLGLNNMGVDITALIAGLGVGGIAIALAVQNILGDLFASLTIILDKPFEIGDPIQVGEFTGSVEKVGLKTTRIRSVTGEEMVFSNADLLQSRIRNYKRMHERRVLLQLGVTFATPLEKLRSFPKLVQNAIEYQSTDVRFDRCHLSSLGDSAILFETVYWVKTPDYPTHIQNLHRFHLRLLETMASEGIECAFPTRTITLAPEDRRALSLKS
jgi:small-conductance mechanosensitive channel